MTVVPAPEKLRILHAVEFYHPSVGGAQAVVREVSERLAARGHHVTVATTALPQRRDYLHAGVHIVGFDVSGNTVRGLRGAVDRYQRFLADGRFDVMMAYAAQQWTVDAAWALFDRLPYASVLAPCGFSGLHDPTYADYFRRLPRLLRRFDRLIFHSDVYQDRAFCDRHHLQDLSVTIPNAAAAEDFPPPDPENDPARAAAFRERHGIPADGPLLLTVGNHTGQKGHACTIKAFGSLTGGPAHLLVVGRGGRGRGCFNACQRAAGRRGPGTVHQLELPRAETLAAFRAADLFLFPSEVECSPLVLYECLAAGLPFITSPAGNAQEIADWSGAGLVASATRQGGTVRVQPQELARLTNELLADPARRTRLAAEARAAFTRRFDWERVTDRYEALYREAVALYHARATDR